MPKITDGPGLPADLNRFTGNFEAEIGTYDPRFLSISLRVPEEKMAAILATHRNPSAATQKLQAILQRGPEMLAAATEQAAQVLALATPQQQATRPAVVRKPTLKGPGSNGPQVV